MQTIRGTAVVARDGTLTMRVPTEVTPGEHEVALTVLEGGKPFALPQVHVEHWPADVSLRREDLYDDWGR
jgi:hypothetical protein